IYIRRILICQHSWPLIRAMLRHRMDSAIGTKDHETFTPGHTEARICSKHLTNCAIFKFQQCSCVILSTVDERRIDRLALGGHLSDLAKQVAKEIDAMNSHRNYDSSSGLFSIIEPVIRWQEEQHILHYIKANSTNRADAIARDNAANSPIVGN